MRNSRANRSFPTRLWVTSVVAIIAIAAVGVIVKRAEGNVASPIAWRLAAAVIVTICVAIAKVVGGTRAAAVTGIAGTAVAVVLLIAFA